MTQAKITLYLDVISPFAYIAYYLLRNSEVFKQCEITYVPMFLGGVMQATGNRAPVTIKNKDKWIMLERERWAKYFNIPIAKEVPVPFPQPTINTQRALCYIQAKHPDKLIAAFDALYKAFWVERKTINDPQVISAALEGPLGKEVTAEVLEGLKGDEAKQVLRANSDQALNDGCFGLPYFVATNAKGEIEKYWGVDHMGMLMDHLGVEVPRKANGFQALL